VDLQIAPYSFLCLTFIQNGVSLAIQFSDVDEGEHVELHGLDRGLDHDDELLASFGRQCNNH